MRVEKTDWNEAVSDSRNNRNKVGPVSVLRRSEIGVLRHMQRYSVIYVTAHKMCRRNELWEVVPTVGLPKP